MQDIKETIKVFMAWDNSINKFSEWKIILIQRMKNKIPICNSN